MMYGYTVWWGLGKLALFVLGSFVFSVTFWATKNWLENPKKRKR